MPTPDGYLTKEDMERVRAWLVEKGVGSVCPACKQKGALAVEMAYGKVDVHPVPRHSFPCAVLTCNHCGYMRLFNTVVMGIAQRAPAPKGVEDVGDE